MNTESNASGAIASSPKATSGPSIAPVVSRARWTPNAVPSVAGVLDSEIIASRGAVRMPFPVRSRSTSAPIAENAPPATTRPSLQTAEIPYPTVATSLWRRVRSAVNPLTSRTSAEAPWYTPSTTPYWSGVKPSVYTR